MRRFNGIETMEETEITYRVGHFDKGCFSGVIGIKAYLACIHEKMGDEELRTAKLDRAFEFSCPQYCFITVVKIYLKHHQSFVSYRHFH